MEPKNLLVIMSDQHSAKIVGCYGNSLVQTPNLDALARDGSRFAHAYCTVPVCVPSRASFATGRYANTLDSWDNAKPYTGAEAASWGHRLTARGHNVTTIGKLHYRRTDDPTGFPDQRIPMHILNGVGDLYGLLRADMPVVPSGPQHVRSAHAGESEYTRYDQSIARTSAEWLKTEGTDQDKPWALFVSFVTPHFPLVVPDEYFNLYPLDSLPLPIQAWGDERPEHPVLSMHRHLAGYEDPIDEYATRRATAAYYGLVTFLDAQIGLVLEALEDAGLRQDTRIIYTSDHGEMLGNRGLWGKGTMYEEAVAVPLILNGPDVPNGKVVTTNASLIDGFPSIVEAVGAQLAPEDIDLPGESLWSLAQQEDRPRTVFSEYHAGFSPSAFYMIRNERYKYVNYVGYPPQLFDLDDDPAEVVNLAADPAYTSVRSDCEQALRAIVDPEAVDARARDDQGRRIDAAGGREAVLTGGAKIPYTPAPSEFGSGIGAELVDRRVRAEQRHQA